MGVTASQRPQVLVIVFDINLILQMHYLRRRCARQDYPGMVTVIVNFGTTNGMVRRDHIGLYSCVPSR